MLNPEQEDATMLQNIRTYTPNCIVSHPRSLDHLVTPQRECHVSPGTLIPLPVAPQVTTAEGKYPSYSHTKITHNSNSKCYFTLKLTERNMSLPGTSLTRSRRNFLLLWSPRKRLMSSSYISHDEDPFTINSAVALPTPPAADIPTVFIPAAT